MTPFIRYSLGSWLFCLAPLAAVGQPPLAPPKVVRLAHDGLRVCVAFSPDSKTLATGGGDSHIRIWDVATGKERLAIRATSAGSGFSRLAYFPDGKLLASAGWFGGGTVRLWDTASGKEKKPISKNEGGVSVLAVSPDGKFLAWGNGGKTELYDVVKDRVAHSFSVLGAVDSAAFSSDNKLLATAHGGGIVHLWDVATGKPVREMHARQIVATGSQAVAFSPDGKSLATASAKVRLWNVATGEEIAELGSPNDHPFCIAISADGRLLACGGMSGSLRLWDLKTRNVIHSWDESAASVAISPDGKWLAFGNRGKDGACLVEIGAVK